MRALAWHGRRDVRVDTVPDPTVELPTGHGVENAIGLDLVPEGLAQANAHGV